MYVAHTVWRDTNNHVLSKPVFFFFLVFHRPQQAEPSWKRVQVRKGEHLLNETVEWKLHAIYLSNEPFFFSYAPAKGWLYG